MESHIYVCVHLISNMKFSVNFLTRDLDLKKNNVKAGLQPPFFKGEYLRLTNLEDCLSSEPLRDSYVIGSVVSRTVTYR